MKITTLFSKKVPGSEEYSSLGYHLQLEIEPPAAVREDKTQLRRYVQALFDECRNQVEEALRGASTASKTPDPTPRTSRRPHAPMRGPANRGHGRRNGDTCTLKQSNFLKALSRDAGLSYGELDAMCLESFGKNSVAELSRGEASKLIDELRPPDRE